VPDPLTSVVAGDGARDLSSIARPSGALAMVAIDQREALRAMMAERRCEPVGDADVTAFKLDATRALTPYASGVLLDRQFVLDQAIEQGAVTRGCGLIAAADHFVPGTDELVADAVIDEEVDPARYAACGVVALKLLIVWRPDEDPQRRVDMVHDFVARARAAGLISIIEPVSRAPRDGRDWDWGAGVLAAARELGDLGADLYKAEVPLHGEGDEADVRRECAAISDAVGSPWVVLSSGVRDEVFPHAVELAMREGASGFLAGRAVWRTCLAAADVRSSLQRDAVARLQRLCEVVDRVAAER
jgi:sulfofructosephosphate aldolase